MSYSFVYEEKGGMYQLQPRQRLQLPSRMSTILEALSRLWVECLRLHISGAAGAGLLPS
jgi:hypothetical protein